MLMVFGGEVRGQICTPQVRKYATRQQDFSTLLASVSSPTNAVDGNVKTNSTLNILGLLGLVYAEQVVDFNPDPNSNSSYSTMIDGATPINVKLSLPSSLLGVLGGIEIQPIKNMRRTGSGGLLDPYIWKYDPVGNTVSGSDLNLLGVLNGSGQVEITITPGVDYQGVRIRLTSAVGLGTNAGFYGAYINQNSTSSSNTCASGVDVLSGVRAGSVVGGIANATGGIVDPYNAIDSDLPSPTFAQINVGVQLLSKAYLSTIFNTPAQAGDVVRIVLQDPGSVLLNLTLLNGFVIQPYLNNVPAGPAFTQTSNLLTLQLLNGPGNIYALTFPVSTQFDRVEISMGGVLNALGSLRIYDVKRIILPTTQIDGVLASSKAVCQNNTATLSIKDPQDCTTYNWYNTSTGGTILSSSTSYTPPASNLIIGDNIFYVEAIRNNCAETSGRIPLTIKVNPLPSAGTITGNSGVCVSQTTILSNSTTGGTWSTNDATKATISASGIVTGVAPGSAIITYAITDPVTGCTNSTTKNITINPLPNAGSITGNSSVCVNQTITLSNVVSGGIWASTDNTKATISSGGVVTGIAQGQTTITYTVTNAGCSSAAAVVITVNPLPNATISGTVTVCQGTPSQAITFTGSNGTSPYTFTYNINGGSSTTITTALGDNTVTIPISTNTQGTFIYNLLGVMDASSTQCSNIQTGSATIIVNPKPPAPHVAITTNSQY